MCPTDVASLAQFPAPEPQREPSSRWADERALLEAIRSGDRDAAEAMVERTYPAVYASLFRLCSDGDLAADLTQETYQKAWSALRRFDGRSQLFTWLYRIAYTTFLNHVRRPRRTTSLDEPYAADLAGDDPAADQVLLQKEDSERVRAAVLRLPDDLRFTVTAHFWGGLPVREIAQLENITTVAIRKRLHKAFSILEAMMDEDLR
ncbi:MAG TPA: sigma-70 family RNA polymerase sigma factor [Thermoanaerobaculia bacterium]|nr:sigma-70 family RNA polymerase sigma factor [Thermoanaerobaculia bacterium]